MEIGNVHLLFVEYRTARGTRAWARLAWDNNHGCLGGWLNALPEEAQG